MNLATVLYQKPYSIPSGVARKVSKKLPEDDVSDFIPKANRVCTGCGDADTGTNFYRHGTRCKKCQKEQRCLKK